MGNYNKPRLTVSKKDSTCKCGNEIEKGKAIYIDPVSKEGNCMECYELLKLDNGKNATKGNDL